MNYNTITIKKYNGYKINGKIALAKAKKLYLHRYPSNKTLENLKKLGVNKIVYENGDFITL